MMINDNSVAKNAPVLLAMGRTLSLQALDQVSRLARFDCEEEVSVTTLRSYDCLWVPGMTRVHTASLLRVVCSNRSLRRLM